MSERDRGKCANLYHIRGVESWSLFGLGRLVGRPPGDPSSPHLPPACTEAARPASHSGRPPRCRSAAYSPQAPPRISASDAPAAPGLCLDTVLCLKYRRRVGRDNTVKYRWRTLQLLPDRARPSYAGSVVEVLEGLDGRLAVQHEGRTVASQQAPPRPSVLRSFDTRTVHTAGPSRYTNGVIRRSEDEVASMDTMLEADRLRDDADRNGAARVRKTVTPRSRKPTPLQTARWKAVQKAKRKGLSIRGIARELSIHRDTARKYMNAESPPMSPARATPAAP